MSVRVTLNCQIKPDNFPKLLPFLEENLANVRAFPGNERVSIFFDQSNNEMLIDEDWTTVNHHQIYIDFISDNGVMAKLIGFFTEPPAVKYFDMVDI